jgi:hypothetical protein
MNWSEATGALSAREAPAERSQGRTTALARRLRGENI